MTTVMGVVYIAAPMGFAFLFAILLVSEQDSSGKEVDASSECMGLSGPTFFEAFLLDGSFPVLFDNLFIGFLFKPFHDSLCSCALLHCALRCCIDEQKQEV